MPHFKIHFAGAFGDNEAIVEAESAEEAQAKFGADTPDRAVLSVNAYEQTLGQTLIMGTSTGGYGGVFGFGEDLAKAKAGFRKNGGALGKGYDVIVFDAETDFIGVTGGGSYRWMGNVPTVTTVAAR